MAFVGACVALRRARALPRAVSRRAPWRACAAVSRETVVKTAKLAQLYLSDAEVDTLTPEFQKIVGFVGAMSELDVEGIEPMSRVEDTTNVLRDDVPVAFPDMCVCVQCIV
jgi:aspartyl/glutamyl-tRNA(Asn/Gln) amidotransferase C subunit